MPGAYCIVPEGMPHLAHIVFAPIFDKKEGILSKKDMDELKKIISDTLEEFSNISSTGHIAGIAKHLENGSFDDIGQAYEKSRKYAWETNEQLSDAESRLIKFNRENL